MQNTGREGSALKSPAAWVRFLAVVVAGTVLDLWSKHWAFLALKNEETLWSKASLDALGRKLLCLEFIWQENFGAVLGVGQGRTAMFVGFTFLALALLTWLFVDSKRSHSGLHLFLGCVVAGAIGNLYDRMQFAYVRDFLRFTFRADWATWGGDSHYVWPYVFNIADVFISVGVFGLFLVWLVSLIQHRQATSKSAGRT